jgi:hypothetical protein
MKLSGSPENEAVIEQINAIKPNILIIGLAAALYGLARETEGAIEPLTH